MLFAYSFKLIYIVCPPQSQLSYPANLVRGKLFVFSIHTHIDHDLN